MHLTVNAHRGFISLRKSSNIRRNERCCSRCILALQCALLYSKLHLSLIGSAQSAVYWNTDVHVHVMIYLCIAILQQQALASPALKPRHWELLSEKMNIGSTIEPDEELTLLQLVELNVGQHIEVIQEVLPHCKLSILYCSMHICGHCIAAALCKACYCTVT
jgi:hypothetical protein